MSLSTLSIAATAVWVLVRLASPPAEETRRQVVKRRQAVAQQQAETDEYLRRGDLTEGNYLYTPSPFKEYPVAYYRPGPTSLPGISIVYFELNLYRDPLDNSCLEWATVTPDSKPLSIKRSAFQQFITQKRVPNMSLVREQRQAICDTLDHHSKNFTQLMDGFQVHGVYSSNLETHMSIIFIARKYAKMATFQRVQEANKASTLSITISEAHWSPAKRIWEFSWSKSVKEVGEGKELRVTNLKVENPSENNTGWIWCSDHDRWKIVWDEKGHVHVGWAHRYWSPIKTMKEAEEAFATQTATADTSDEEPQGERSVLLELPTLPQVSAESPEPASEQESSAFTENEQDETNTTASANSIVSSICEAASEDNTESVGSSQLEAQLLDGFYKNLKEKLRSRVRAKRRASAWEHVTQIYNIGYPECETTGVVLIDSGNGMVSLIEEETARAIKATKVGGVSTGAGIGGADFQIDHHVVVGIRGDKQDYQVLCGVVDSIGDGYNVLLNDRWIEEYHPEARPHGFMIRGSKSKKNKKQRDLDNEEKERRKADQEKKAAEREEKRQAILQELEEQRTGSKEDEDQNKDVDAAELE